MFVLLNFLKIMKKILIEPQWNVDQYEVFSGFRYDLILIEPQWNVDKKEAHGNEGGMKILIEPQWNVDLTVEFDGNTKD